MCSLVGTVIPQPLSSQVGAGSLSSTARAHLGRAKPMLRKSYICSPLDAYLISCANTGAGSTEFRDLNSNGCTTVYMSTGFDPST